MNSPMGTAAVTGASAGIGKAYADRLAARGFDLILVARRVERLASYAEALRQRYGVSVQAVPADLSRSPDLERVIAVLEADDRLTLLVNNAGTSTLGSSTDMRSALVDEMIDVNVKALTRLALAVLPGFQSRGAGTLINIGSVLGYHTLPISSIYSGTKGYVHNFTRGLQQELASTKIVVQLVLPAATATDLWEIAGVPLSALDPAHVMSIDACVDAALAGLDRHESITLPSLDDPALLATYEKARLALFESSQSGKPARRYLSTV